jgi:hypothetical protein
MPNKNPERWNTPIISTPNATLTKRQVFDYYSNPTVRKEILKAVGKREVVVRQSFSPGNNVLRRKDPLGDFIKFETPAQFNHLVNKRLTEVHPTFGKKVNFLLADVDPQTRVPWNKTKAITETVAKTMKQHPQVKGVNVRFSGGRGFYIQGLLNKPMHVDKARELTKKILDGIAKRPDVTFGIARPNQIRIDMTPLKFRGSVRAPFSLNASTGLVSTPVALDKIHKAEKGDFTINKIVKKAAKMDVIDEENNQGDQGVTYRREGEAETNLPDHPTGANIHTIKDNAERIATRLKTGTAKISEFRFSSLAAAADDITIPFLRRWLSKRKEKSDQPQPLPLPLAPEQPVLTQPMELLPQKMAAAKTDKPEFAPGIPADKKIHNIPNIRNRAWTLSIQKHDAAKAGPHWDLRLVDPVTNKAHSFAVPRMRFPAEKEILLGIQQPTHGAHYALNFEGEVPKGTYGAGTVKQHLKEPIDILKANADGLTFRRPTGERIALFRMHNKNWGMRKLPEPGKVDNKR